MSVVNDTVLTYLPPKRKQTPSGWTSFNAPCCQHNGTTADTRQRGGLIFNPDGISYHCFNCGFKASWQQGRNLSIKMKKLLQWLNAPDDVITKLALTVMQQNEGIEVKQKLIDIPKFNTVPLPLDAVKISECTSTSDQFAQVVDYMKQRKLFLEDYEYYWSPSLGYRDRLIIPFYYEKRLVGWTARSVDPNKKPKYLTDSQPGFVYGLDEQSYNKVFCILCEGPIDALHVDGCALTGSDIGDAQALLLNRLQKDIYVVPDRDKAGSKLVEQAIDRGWSVSMPDWSSDIKDIGDAVNKYGRLYTLYSIASAAEYSPLKIRLKAKKWFT